MASRDNTVRNIFSVAQSPKVSGDQILLGELQGILAKPDVSQGTVALAVLEGGKGKEELSSEPDSVLPEQDDVRAHQEQKAERARQEQKAKMVAVYRKQLVKLPFLTEKVYKKHGAVHPVRDQKAIATRLAEVLADSPVAEELLKDEAALRERLALIIQKEFSGKDSTIETDADTSEKDEGIEERGIHGKSLHGRGNLSVAALPEALSTDFGAETPEGSEEPSSQETDDSPSHDIPETAFIDAKKIDQIEDYIRDQWKEKKEVHCNVRGEGGTLEKALILGFTIEGKFKLERENGTDVDVTAEELIELNPSILVASERAVSGESSASRPVLVEGELPKASTETEPALTDHETQGESTPTQEKELSKQEKFLLEIFGDSIPQEAARELWDFLDDEMRKYRKDMRAWMRKEKVPMRQRLVLLNHPEAAPRFLDSLLRTKLKASELALPTEVESKLREVMRDYMSKV